MRGLRFNVVDRREDKNVVPAAMLRGVAKRIAPFGWHIEIAGQRRRGERFRRMPWPTFRCRSCSATLGYPKSGARHWTRHQEPLPICSSLIDDGRCWIKLTGPYRITSDADIPYEDVDAEARALDEGMRRDA